MSLFDKKAGFDPSPWLKEKTLACLREVAGLVDLANEADTTPWYARRLQRSTSALVAWLAPVTLFVNGSNQNALQDADWNTITEHGTFGLASWCKRWGIAGAEFLREPLAEEDSELDKDAIIDDDPEVDDDFRRTLEQRAELMGLLAGRLMNADVSNPGRRLLLLAISQLRYSPFCDIVFLSKRFLPADMGVSAEETAIGYRDLYELKFVERVDDLAEESPDRLALRLLVEGYNERKHTTPYREETFGYPGARISGKQTIGNLVSLAVSPFVKRAFESLPALDEDNQVALRSSLQVAVGEDRAFIEEASFVARDTDAVIVVKLRYPIDDSADDLESMLTPAAEAWLRQHIAGHTDSGLAPYRS